MGAAITVQGLWKRFALNRVDRPVTFMEWALAGFKGVKPIDHFWALQDVSFTVAPGEMLGVIGKNGAGKSTLLQLVGGIGRPNKGKIKVNGRIGALLDLGSGLHPDLTGRENIFVAGVVAGLIRLELQQRFDDIVEFAELGQFIDNPVRTYSSGMVLRLAFSIAVHTYPEVLLIDEFLAVGDIGFQRKCMDRIMSLKYSGCAILFISQTPDAVQVVCDRALLLHQGQVVELGEPGLVAQKYRSIMESAAEDKPGYAQQEDKPVKITGVSLLPSSQINSGEAVVVEISYQVQTSQLSQWPIFSLRISRGDNHICFGTTTFGVQPPTSVFPKQGKVRLYLDRLDLSGGEYFIDVGIHDSENIAIVYDYSWHTYSLLVRSNPGVEGTINPPYHWDVTSKGS